MFFNRNKNQDKPENNDVKTEKSGFFSFFSRSTPTEKAAPEAVEIEAVEAEVADTRVIVNETFAAETAEAAALPVTTADDATALVTKAPEIATAIPDIPAPVPDTIILPSVVEISSPAVAEINLATPSEITPPIESTFVAPAVTSIAEMLAATQAKDNELARPKTDPVAEKPKNLGWFARIKQGLSRTSSQFAEGFGTLLMGKKAIDDELLEELETQLLVADVGIDATTEIIDQLTKSVERKQLADSDALYLALQTKLEEMLIPAEHPLVIDTSKKPFVILVVGVNGVGKTTTIGKLAYQLRQEGKSVMLAAGDTFRAAAVEQLQVWGERNDIHVVAQHTGADSASVIFDAISSAKAKGLDVVICDTAGRLHNKNHLMDELAKVRRVIAKLDPTAPHESLLVLDAGTGQNAVSQTEHFKIAAGVTGLALTKLDGTAKGGIIFALSQKFKLPVRFIGVGEGIEDLQTFRAKAFVDALFNRNSSNH